MGLGGGTGTGMHYGMSPDLYNGKVAVLGASKFGQWHAREYKAAGYNVVAILGSSQESAEKTASMLEENLGHTPRAYGSVNKLFENERLDAVSIVTPPKTHYELAKISIAHGVDFLLEKPPVIGIDSQETLRMYGDIMEEADRKNVLFANQQQHVGMIHQYSDIMGKYANESSEFYFEVKNGGHRSGLDLAEDQLPHPISVLTNMFGHGKVKEKAVDFSGPLRFEFDYEGERGNCACSFVFDQVPDLPREENIINVGFNGDHITRRQSTEGGFRQWLSYKGEEYEFVDPLKISIRAFLDKNPLVSAKDGFNSLKVQLDLLSHCL